LKSIVIYQSKSGFTKKYAEWIAEEIHADLFELKTVSLEMLKNYDVVVYGGGLYVGGINGITFLKRNLASLKDKKIAVYATGATPFRQETIDEVYHKNFSKEEQQQIKFFYMRGGFNFKALNVTDKLLMTLLKLKIRMKPENKRVADEKGMLAAYSKDVDFTRRKNIDSLILFLKD
jgi:menaquinone-dependent protoporphyrinogen IX oxidase